jgi:transcriptional regulator with PAS, ATPase and Fis domain
MEAYRLGGLKPIKFDVRVIAATNRNLWDLVKEGRFREDLFYRLYVVPIEVPPLRERREDIFPLAWHFLKLYNQKYKQCKTLSSELIEILELYSWPGNVRELQNIIERLIVTIDAEVLTPEHLPNNSVYHKGDADDVSFKTSGGLSLSRAKDQVERAILSQALKMKRTTREIASQLGVDHSTVVRKLQKYGLSSAGSHQKKVI